MLERGCSADMFWVSAVTVSYINDTPITGPSYTWPDVAVHIGPFG
jgi:hypothetical protein